MLSLHHGDLSDGTGLVNLLREVQPDEVYHLGAQSHVKVSFEMPEYTGNRPMTESCSPLGPKHAGC